MYFTSPIHIIKEYNTGVFQPAYGVGLRKNKLYAEFGKEILIWGNHEELKHGALLSPSFILHNFSGGQSVPWQMWRARISTSYLFKILEHQQFRAFTNSGVFHESNHVTDTEAYRKNYTASYFDNQSMRSFEAAFLNFRMEHFFRNLSSRLEIRPEFYTNPIDPYSKKRIYSAIITGLYTQYNLTQRHSIFLEFRYEYMKTDYSVAKDIYHTLPDGHLARYALFTGYRFKGYYQNEIILSLGYEYGHGRGMDFFHQEDGFSCILKFLI